MPNTIGIVTDATGASIVIEYTKGARSIYDDKVGAMTKLASSEWHLLNLRNYANLQPLGAPAPRNIDGVSLAPLGRAGAECSACPVTSRRRTGSSARWRSSTR